MVSAAGNAHMARHRRCRVRTVDNKVMALGFARNGFADGGNESGVVIAGTERRAEVGGVVLAEAHEQRPGTGQPYAIAGFAKIVSERRDEADPLAGFAQRDIARRAA